jgi:hypothetical protein
VFSENGITGGSLLHQQLSSKHENKDWQRGHFFFLSIDLSSINNFFIRTNVFFYSSVLLPASKL